MKGQLFMLFKILALTLIVLSLMAAGCINFGNDSDDTDDGIDGGDGGDGGDTRSIYPMVKDSKLELARVGRSGLWHASPPLSKKLIKVSTLRGAVQLNAEDNMSTFLI